MFRKMILLLLIFTFLLPACIPIGQIEVGVEQPTLTPEATQTALPAPDIEDEGASETEEPVIEEKQYGTVEGKICIPGSWIPPMTLYFQSTATGRTYELVTAESQGQYSIELPVGQYTAFAYTGFEPGYDAPEIGGQYSEMVPCGLSVECVDHSPLPFEVLASSVTEEIDICDWYAPEAVPANPMRTIPVSPNLTGFLFLSGDTIYRVEEGGTAVPLISPYGAQGIVVSEDGRQALFSQGEDVYLADLETASWQQLTFTPELSEGSFRFVPGEPGYAAFFVSDASGDPMMTDSFPALIRLDGTDYRTIDIDACCNAVSVHPDGEQIAFTAGESAWLYEIESGNLEAFNAEDFGLQGELFYRGHSWSPDGSKMAWWMQIDDLMSLVVFDFASFSHALVYTYQPIGGGGSNTNPIWSADGQWLATIVLGDGSKGRLGVFSTSGQEDVDLGSAGSYIWSSNGKALLYRAWPEDGGPAWDSTLRLHLISEGQIVPLDVPVGAEPLGFSGD